MAGSYSPSIHERKSPQYAYALVILSGGIAFIVTQNSDSITGWLFYALLAALFSFIWPDKASQWACWLCLPIFLLIVFDLIVAWSPLLVWRNGVVFVKALPSACLGVYLGYRLSGLNIASRLINAGADVNVADDEGKTALMHAAGENIGQSLRALLDAGADPHIRDHKGQTALMLARKHEHTQGIKLLKSAQAKAPAGIDAPANFLSGDDAFLYLLKEELEEMLTPHSGPPSLAADDAVSRLLSALQTVQAQIDAAKKERSLAPSEISHKLALTLQEAASLSGLPRQHLLEAIEARSLKARFIKYAWRITRANLDDYIRRLR
jgi:excisionase family DNA binding protein